MGTTPGNRGGKTDPPPSPPPPAPALLLKTFYPWALLESWESSSKLKCEQTRSRAASSPRLSSATLQGGWADWDCKLISIPVRAAHFNFQPAASGCAPGVAAVPAQLSAALTSGVWEREQKQPWDSLNLISKMSPEMFFISLVPTEETESDACLSAFTQTAVILPVALKDRS